MKVGKFIKLPVEIEAVLYDGSMESVLIIIGMGGTRGIYNSEDGLYIQTLEGTMKADKGDWIIKGVKGEIYPCKPDIFEATYKPVERA